MYIYIYREIANMKRRRRCLFGCKEFGVLHNFPQPKGPSLPRFLEWKEMVGRTGVDNNYVYYNDRLCNRHFETFYFNSHSKRLTRNAYPTLNIDREAVMALKRPLSTKSANETSKVTDTAQGGSLSMEDPSNTKIYSLPATEPIDYVGDGSSFVEEPVFEFDPNDSFSLQNIEIPKEPPKKMKCVKPVMRSELCAERVRTTSDTRSSKLVTCEVDDSNTTDTVAPEHTDPAPEEINNETRYWKIKLTQILHSTKFCGVCLSKDNVSSVYDQFEIVVCERSHTTTLADILRVVFTETEDFLSSSQICNNCTNKLIQSYMFIQQARETSRILNSHFNDLYNKTCYIKNRYLGPNNQKPDDIKNVLISLENYDNVDRIYNIYTREQKKTVENKSQPPKLKRKFKCLRCNLYLPSYKAWMIHEISTHHRNKKDFQTKTNLCKPNARVLRKICKICNRVIENGGFIDHMKKYHGQSRVCSICNVSFSSFKDFVSHKDEWHYRADSKCLTCLKSYSEVELEQHQCRFGCGSCAEVPCLHHKYLMCYREQILKGALRAKCLDCNYVCRTKTALLKHVNLCHLKYRPKVS